jgi:hypothetical protein
VSPQKKTDKSHSREAATAIVSLPPLRGSHVRCDPDPWVDTHGYVLPPLRG